MAAFLNGEDHEYKAEKAAHLYIHVFTLNINLNKTDFWRQVLDISSMFHKCHSEQGIFCFPITVGMP